MEFSSSFPHKKLGQAAQRRYCFKVKRVQWAVPAPSSHRFSARLSVTVWLWITLSGRKVRCICQTPFFAARQTQFNFPAAISPPPAAFPSSLVKPHLQRMASPLSHSNSVFIIRRSSLSQIKYFCALLLIAPMQVKIPLSKLKEMK